MIQKLKIGSRSFIEIKLDNGIIDYAQWVLFIESRRDYFTWYEETEQGIRAKNNLDRFSEGMKKILLYRLSKTTAYSTTKIVKDPFDFVIHYDKNKYISVHLEKKITLKIAALLLEMAKYFGAKIIIDDKKEFYSLEQLK